ncbi:hypothetical protein APHAL10511_007711 [Amanita phalloides]|nr:hypothetical protein APHAL10511_007711 [Amanita phalloides]
MSISYLDSLNHAQLRSVESPPDIPLQILAGPGSGKTKVLTSRIAHLILRHALSPSSICAVTFTNKAANEMRERLKKILGKERVGEVQMGTFHSLCARFLRKYANAIGLSDNFSICDADESKRIIRQLLTKYREFLASRNMTIKEETIMSKISKAKAKSITADKFAAEVEQTLRERGMQSFDEMFPPDILEKISAEVYQEYEKLLRRNNALDFDDLLLFGVQMFKAQRKAVTWCQHVLVDEFQDTNTIQYDLMRTIAYKGCVTIVGDPDQSIYGWRSAEVENLDKMKRDFPGTREIFLEENYRSTGAILRLSLAIISEDTNRIPKSLYTSHPAGNTPTFQLCPNELDEANFIALEIKRVIAYMGASLQFGDFAILLRFNALSRVIERSLQKEGIPCRIVGGHRFFERVEVKDLLAYLQLVDNSNFYPAFARAVNVPSRGVGEKTLLEVASKAEQSGMSHLGILEHIHDGKIPDIKPPAKRKIGPFIDTIRILRELVQNGTSPAEILRRLIHSIDYMEHLKKTQTDWESRWANVEELINFATEVGIDSQNIAEDNSPLGNRGEPKEATLRLFLQASSLSSEGDSDSNNTTEGKVTIATCHAAKGLEWPVVMIPSVEDGTFPLGRSEDIEEERSDISYLVPQVNDSDQAVTLRSVYESSRPPILVLYPTADEFIGNIPYQQVFIRLETFINYKCQDIVAYECAELDADNRRKLSAILHRETPDEAEVTRKVAEYNDMIKNRANRAAEPEKNTVPVPRQVPSSTVSVPPTASPMPTFRTSNRMQLAHALRHIRENQSNNDESSSICDGATTLAGQNDILTMNSVPSRAEMRWSRPDNTEESPRPAPLIITNQVDGSIQIAQSRVPNRPTPYKHFATSRSNASGITHSMTQPMNPSPVQIATSNTQPLNRNAPEPQRGQKARNPTIFTPRLSVEGIRENWPNRDEEIYSTPNSSGSLTTSPQSPTGHDNQGLKRRLGMGRVTTGYTNKKFKLPY